MPNQVGREIRGVCRWKKYMMLLGHVRGPRWKMSYSSRQEPFGTIEASDEVTRRWFESPVIGANFLFSFLVVELQASH